MGHAFENSGDYLLDLIWPLLNPAIGNSQTSRDTFNFDFTNERTTIISYGRQPFSGWASRTRCRLQTDSVADLSIQ